MSIARLAHLSLIAPAAEGGALLVRLQALGCVHVVGFDGLASIEVDQRVHAAARYIAAAPRQRHRVRRAREFEPAALVARTEELRVRAQALENEREALKRRIADVAPWGHFSMPDLVGHPELRFWFYRIPPARLGELARSGHVWRMVNRTSVQCFIVVVAAQEPDDLPFPRVHFGSRPLAELEARLADVEVELDDVEEERTRLTRWRGLFADHIDRLLDDAAREHAAAALAGDGALVWLNGWVAVERAAALVAWAEREGYALQLRDPLPEEAPPTLLVTAPAAAAGAGLVRFFTTPAYGSWDPSLAVMVSFTVFFAMIMGDAAYGAILCLALALGWRAMGRRETLRPWRVLAALLALATTGWGVLTGSYAGMQPPTRWLAAVKLVPAENPDVMLRVALGVGLAHLVLANALAAWRLRDSSLALARIGWIGIFAAAPLWLVSQRFAYALAALGVLLVLAFTGSARHPLHRLAEGLMALPRLVGVLGDTLSYLRLFALGIATAALAAAFNTIAANVATVPGTGVVFGALILVAGHGINLLLGVAGGVIHGLRLNYIEFFGWGLWGDGRPFVPFEKREQMA